MKAKLRLFLSCTFNSSAQNAVDAFKEVAITEGFQVITGEPPGVTSPTKLVRSRIFSSDCFAALMTTHGETCKSSAWISNEIGIAYALDMPLLICKERSVEDAGLASIATSYLTFDKDKLTDFKASLQSFLRNVRKDFLHNKRESLGKFINDLVRHAIDGRLLDSGNNKSILDKASAALDNIIGNVPTDLNLLRIYSKSDIVRDVLKRLNSFEGLEPKLAIASEKKDAMAKAFVELHGDDVKSYDEIFLESGSTIAAIAKKLAGKLPHEEDWTGKVKPLVKTNNAFAYLYLWLCAGVLCEPVPEGPPDPRFGGMYGPLTVLKRAPDYKSPLQDYDPKALNIIKGMSKTIFSDDEVNSHTLVLAASSGLQLSDEFDAIRPIITKVDGFVPEAPIRYEDKEVLSQLKENCRGFHVGSYENHLFKRCLYLTKAPTIVFIHDKKIDSSIEVGKCHFVFDSNDPWSQAIKDHPLSLWVACEKESYKNVKSKLQQWLKEGGWEFNIYAEASDYPIVIGHNALFRDSCKSAGVKPFSRLR